ncbi:MAG: hypothetical protein Q8R47_03770 [Nanoarchaeota archaeon]|nr:hypothetical protein [Nanoarchaeota archaeon]
MGKGVDILPESLYLLSFLGLTGFCYGARTHPELKVDVPMGLVYSSVTVALAGATGVLAYMAERLIQP